MDKEYKEFVAANSDYAALISAAEKICRWYDIFGQNGLIAKFVARRK